MRKIYSYLLLTLFLSIGLNAWADETTISVGTSSIEWTADGNDYTATSGDFTLRYEKGSYGNSISGGLQSAELRLYSGTNFVISSTNTITEIVYNVADGSGKNYSVSALSTEDGNLQDGTWTGSATSVSASLSAQNRIKSVTITYTSSSSTLDDCDLALTGAPIALTFDLYNNASAQIINYTTSSTGAVTVSNSQYIEADVDEENQTITINPIKKTAEAQTITVNQAADENYNAGSATFTVTITDSTPKEGAWELANLEDLTEDDVFVIVGNNGADYAMSNDNGTGSAPSAVAVTIEDEEITSDVDDNIKWNVSGNATDGYTFYPNGDTEKWLYCTSSNNGVRVGTNAAKTFTISDEGYLLHSGTSRYLGIYSSQDWRCYTSINSNISGQTFGFYKYVDGSGQQTETPSISASNVDLAYDATSGSISFTVKNPVDGGSISAATTSDWLTVGSLTEGAFPLTCAANVGDERTATVTLTYTYNTSETVTKDVTVTQAAAPVVYSTITDLFAAATSTETGVLVTFDNWVVSGVSTNGKNVFVTDGTNGFVIYYSSDMSGTYAVNNILSGTAVSCTLKKYNGFAELLNVNASDLTITTGGSVDVANIEMANLTGVNTGALLHYDNLTCSVDGSKYYLSDGTTTLQVYNAIYAFDALEDGKTYNITGVYQQYNSTKEILPRSAADIEEVVSVEPSIALASYTLNVSADEGLDGTIEVTYNNITNVAAEVYFCNEAGDASATYDWVTAEIDEDDNLYYLLDANTGEARTAYLKVYALDDEAEDVYSDILTITQAAPVVDYATLPFAFDGGRADVETTNGLTHVGLGTDYKSSPYLKFDGTDDYLVLKINEAASLLTFDIKGNTFSDGTFKVQTSVDGSVYADLETYTELDATQSEAFNLASNVRYIKWIYTEKVNGNVALGNIFVGEGAVLSLGANGYSTYAAKYKYTVTGATVYTAALSNTNDDYAILSPVAADAVIPANAGIILNGEEGHKVVIKESTEESTDLTGNQLVGVVDPIDNPGNAYVIATVNEVTEFCHYTGTDQIPAHKAYLPIDSEGAPIRIVFGENNATDLSNLSNDSNLSNATKFMQNGQLFIKKNGVIYNAVGAVVK